MKSVAVLKQSVMMRGAKLPRIIPSHKRVAEGIQVDSALASILR